MSIIEFSLFCFFIFFITVLQSMIVSIYFGEFFRFRFHKNFFLVITFSYMLVMKFFNIGILIRLVLLFLFLFLLSTFTLFGSIEKKFYHVLSFTFSLTLCELTFSIFNEHDTVIQTQHITSLFLYFFITIIFFLIVIIIVKSLVYFREQNNEGLTNKEYLLLSIIPFTSLIITYVSTNMPSLAKSIICCCLICINLSYLILYDMIAKKNYDLHRFFIMEQQNHYYEDRIKSEQDLSKMRHDLKNIFITLDSFLLNNDMESVKKQLQALLTTKTLHYDTLTGCIAIDSILSVKIQKMKENNIMYSHTLQVPSDLTMEENLLLDVSAILGNLLDNAIEAVLR